MTEERTQRLVTGEKASNGAVPIRKKPYHAPQLRKLGSVRDVTRTTNTFSGSDGGTFPNNYAS